MRIKHRKRRGWLPRLVLGAWISLVAAFAATAVEGPLRVEPGQSLAAALGLEGDDYWLCVDGGLPRPLASVARPPAGTHRILVLRREAGALAAVGWREVALGGEATDGPAPAGRLVLDHRPPRATFYATGPHVDDADSLRLAPDAGVRILFDDLSGVRGWQASDRHRPSSDAGRWLAGDHHLSVVAADAAGNRGPAGDLRFVVDADGPAIEWRIVDDGLPAAAGGTIYRSPVTLEVDASDPSGVRGLEAFVDQAWRPLPAGRVTVATDSLPLRASDRLGNRAETEARWRYDRSGPEITLNAPAGQVRGAVVVLPVDGVVTVAVNDTGAGVAEARYRYNNKPFRPLPQSIRFVHRGRYRVEIQARDRLGNETVGKWKVRTVGGRPGGRR